MTFCTGWFRNPTRYAGRSHAGVERNSELKQQAEHPADGDCFFMLSQYSAVASATALEMVQAAVTEAQASGLVVAVAVVDPSGHVLASARMDGATPPTLTFAEDKAYTSATMKRSTQAFAERMTSSTSLTLGLSTRSRLLVWGGGLPIFHEGKIVGGIGVSGATDNEDIEIGKNTLQRFGFLWEA